MAFRSAKEREEKHSFAERKAPNTSTKKKNMTSSLPNEIQLRRAQLMTRRSLLGSSAVSLGAFALGNLLGMDSAVAAPGTQAPQGLPGLPHFAPKAKRVIYLFQSGGPSHVDLFDHHDELDKLHGTDLPDSVRGGQRLTGMTSRQKSFSIVKPLWGGKRCGEHGTWIGNTLPHTQTIADDITIVRSLWTEAINHDPAITFINTGSQQMGHPSMGAWLSYGLGRENEDFPSYMVLLSQGSGKNPGQPLFSRLWGSGYLPSSHQGVMLRPGANPVLYLNNPPESLAIRDVNYSTPWRLESNAFCRGRVIPKHWPGSRLTRWPTGCKHRYRPDRRFR